jgi:hypothetical protein
MLATSQSSGELICALKMMFSARSGRCLGDSENRRDQRARVTDANEEDKVDDVDAPVLGSVKPRPAEPEADLQEVGDHPP